jgi:putative N6-adenine-specific DNA methylase
MEFEMLAKTFKGLEEVLARELTDLGANNVEIQRRAVGFTGDKAFMYKANIHLRTAIRILKPIKTFRAADADSVYLEVKKIKWSDYMDVNTTFAIDATVHSDQFTHSRFVTYRVKDAIVDWFNDNTGKRPSISIENPDVMINIHISQKICTISLDSSGESLHKRGYRISQNEAPLNEALAAGMLLLAGWNGQCDFLDPMCGSGTLLIEAGLIALNIPPGLYRSSFGFEKWHDFDEELFQQIYQDDSGEREFRFKIYGSDVSQRAIKISEQNVKSAGLGKYISLQVKSVKDIEPRSEPCLMVTNPPYGERIKTEDIAGLYELLGATMKHKLTGSDCWVISSDMDCLKKIGLKPAQKIDLLNGALECSYNKYEIFSGKRTDFVISKKNQ